MYQKIKQRFSRGSILAVSLIILGLMLVSALSFALVSIQERKASMGENKSNQAFQTASTGVEIVLQSIRNNIGGKLSDVDSDGICDGKISSPSGYTVQLQDDAGNPVTNCNTSISAVKKVKSVGTIGGNQRAIEVAVAAGCKGGVYVIASGSVYDSTVYNKIKDFVNNNDGRIVGIICTVNDPGGAASHPYIKSVYSDIVTLENSSNNSLGFYNGPGVGAGCHTCVGSANCNKCIDSTDPFNICSSYVILGSCTCDNTCST